MDTIPQDNTPCKQCTVCENSFPATTDFFHRCKSQKDGLMYRCKACVKAYQNSPGVREHILDKKAEYRNRADIKERERAREKEYNARPDIKERNRLRDKERHTTPKRQAWTQEYKSRPEVQEHRRDYMQSYRRDYYGQPENKEHKRETDLAYYHTPGTHERVREQAREYNKTYLNRPKTRDLRRVNARNRRAHKRAANGTHTAQQIQEQYTRQKGKCYYCQHKVKWGKHHVDHVVPLSRGGSNDMSNLVIACAPCNMSKNRKLPSEWPEGGRLL